MAFTAVEGSESATLVGMFFVVEGEEGWQGYVEKSVGPEHYVVQLYSWMDGEPTECKVISIRDAEKRNWSWFFDQEAWTAFGSKKFAQGCAPRAGSDPRVDVLALLREEALSGSEIARRLKRGKGAVLECLDQLANENLIQRAGRTWSLVVLSDSQKDAGDSTQPREQATAEEEQLIAGLDAITDGRYMSVADIMLRVEASPPLLGLVRRFCAGDGVGVPTPQAASRLFKALRIKRTSGGQFMESKVSSNAKNNLWRVSARAQVTDAQIAELFVDGPEKCHCGAVLNAENSSVVVDEHGQPSLRVHVGCPSDPRSAPKDRPAKPALYDFMCGNETWP